MDRRKQRRSKSEVESPHRIECVYRGEKTGKVCCGVSLYSCENDEVTADSCVLWQTSEDRITEAGIRKSGAATCESCPFRTTKRMARLGEWKGLECVYRNQDNICENDEVPLSLCTPSDCKNCSQRKVGLNRHHLKDKPMGRLGTLRSKRRKRHEPSSVPSEDQVLVIDCDAHGVGDACVAAWIAEAYPQKIFLRATDPTKIEFLRLLGQNPISGNEHIDRAVYNGFPLDRMFDGVPSRIESWCATWGLPPNSKRPPALIPQEELGNTPEPKTYALLCPEGLSRQSRCWPDTHWDDLFELVKDHGIEPVFVGIRQKRGNVHDLFRSSWTKIAAWMMNSACVIGIDSGPVHLAGTLNIPSIALLGPTTESIFCHMPSIKCLFTEKRVLPCTGCWWKWSYDNAACERQCEALRLLTPDMVFSEVKIITC